MEDRKFPRTEADIYALAQSMIAGYTANPADFPHSNPAIIQTALDDFHDAKEAQVAAKGAYLAATTVKENRLATLLDTMKAQLKLSEVDCRDVPDNLLKIGWSKRKAKSKLEVPGQPMELVSVVEKYDTIVLDWQAPPDGGAVRAYVIYRRDITLEGEVMQDWTLVATSLISKIVLNKQPRGIQLSYMVKAINRVGESVFSNAVEVVL